MERRLGVGVCGLGAFGESHLRALGGLPDAAVVAVASRSAERAREVAGRHGVARWYEGYEALIADPAVEAVSVTTAEADHLAPALAALAAGKPVLVEKPLATTLADGRAMVEAARRSRAFLMPGHVVRFDPRYAALKAAVAAGELGQLTSLSARRNRTRGHIASHGRTHPALVTAIHDLDVMLWLTAAPVATVRAHHRLGRRPGDPHGIWALLRFANGVVATLESAWMVPEAATTVAGDTFSAIGTDGLAEIVAAPPLQIGTSDGARGADVYYEPGAPDATTGALRNELAYFVACARAGTAPAVVTAEDGLHSLALALALIESAERDAEITCEGTGLLADREGERR
jgi:predicted dehydrogenase